MQIDWIPFRYVHTVCHHMFEFITEYNPAQDSQNGKYESLSTLGVRGKPDISLIEFTNDYSYSSCSCHYYFIFNNLFYIFIILFIAGHKGPGSVFAALQDKGWAMSNSAGKRLQDRRT